MLSNSTKTPYKRKKSFDDIVNNALRMCMENQKLREQLVEVSNVLKASESKCKSLKTDLGQIKSDMSSLLVSSELEESNCPSKKISESNTSMNSKDVQTVELVRKFELIEKQDQELEAKYENSKVRAVFIAYFAECCLEKGCNCAKELTLEGFTLKNAQGVDTASMDDDEDFNVIDWLFLILKYGLCLLGLIALADGFLCYYLQTNNLEISIRSKISPYF